jgi:ABC-2 type transport system ATP-binding protein
VVSGGRLIAESTVAELRGGARLRVVADPIEEAAARARALVGQDRVRVEDGALELDIEPGKAAWINAALVSAGIDVSELGVRERELEDVFLELTNVG